MTDKFEPPHPVSPQGDEWHNWRTFREEWEDYEIATGIAEKDAKVRAATVRTVMGRECAAILKRLQLTENERKNSTAILEKLAAHFKPCKNEIYESFVFNCRIQQPGETAQQYYYYYYYLLSPIALKRLVQRVREIGN